jgi:two-component system sensor histidine kinase KdpD
VPLAVGDNRQATLVVPASIDADALDRLRERIVPALEALLTAALDRDALQAEVVETAALRQSDSVKTALLRAVSHDLRTPLTTILTASTALDSPSLGEDEREELSQSIAQQASRLSRLVDQLLDLSRLEAGMAQPQRSLTSVDELLRSAADEVSQGDADIVVSVDEGVPLIDMDAAQFERALVNLMENARRYSGEQPVKVRAGVTGRRLMIRIVDRGPGISHTEIDRIFEPFYRGDRDASHSGAGLGLSIARGFVEANGGRLSAESLPGQGTTFVIELPLESAPRPAESVEGRP